MMKEELKGYVEHGIPVLDKGFVRLVDVMGDEAAIVQAARVSYGKGTKTLREDVGLIRYLMRHRHTTPLEMCEIKLHVKVPMDCWRQWIRHRTANVNEYSTRYSEALDEMQETPEGSWRLQSSANKQGSDGFVDTAFGGETLAEEERQFHNIARDLYQDRLKKGVAREQARKDLPLSTYTVAYWKIDLHNLLHFLALRLDSHAQLEIRSYALAIAQIVEDWLPNVWAAFKDYRLEAMVLTSRDIAMIRQILTRESGHPSVLAAEWGWDKEKNRERREFEAKIEKMGVPSPW